MKATRIALPLRRPLTTARGTITERCGVVVTRRLADGSLAVAEATPHPDLSETDPEDLYQSLAGGDVAPVPEADAVRSWLELDAAARERRVPAAALLAEAPVNRVAVNGLVGPDGGAAAAVALMSAGLHTLKVKVGGDVEADLRRLTEIRNAVGAAVTLRIDAGGAWDTSTAVRALELLAGLDLEYVEDPLDPADDWSVLEGSDVPLAVDANRPPQEVLEAVTVVVMKPVMLSPDEAMAAAARIRDSGAGIVVTSIIDGAVGVGSALQFAAAVRTPLACGLATSSLLALDLADPPPIREGSMSLDRPGVGVVLESRRLDQLSVTSFSNRSNG